MPRLRGTIDRLAGSSTGGWTPATDMLQLRPGCWPKDEHLLQSSPVLDVHAISYRTLTCWP